MGLLQIIVKWLPASLAEAIESESRHWMLVCPCGREVSVWDSGGVRYKARGTPSVRARCPKCGFTTHRCEFRG